MSKQTDLREPGLTSCDECVFQHASADISTFFCLRRAPVAQDATGKAQWPKLNRDGEPKAKGCGEGRRKKDPA
jgi:hypothetical protein